MNLKKDDLVARLEKIMADHRAAYDEQIRKAEEEEIQAKTDWVNKYNPLWQESANKILKAVKAGLPVTREMLVVDCNKSAEYYYTGKNQGRGYRNELKEYITPVDLEQLLNLVKLCSDDTINITKLGSTRVMNALSTRF